MKEFIGIDLPLLIAILVGSLVGIAGGNMAFWVDLAQHGKMKELGYAALLGFINIIIGGLTAIFMTPLALLIVTKAINALPWVVKEWVFPLALMPGFAFMMGLLGMNIAKLLIRWGTKFELDPVRAIAALRRGYDAMVQQPKTDKDDEQDI
ncbi:hypothetical protein BWI93_03145 [Siphonobacter sp. BAB-5385]|uniref:hypothetical protein n=1 Tax=Siphonobacter sp. BAB-5385 TaxID=1864822 RepID=UPI000B9E002A|nr:hypothetical protein [Siphonobacter sp. BAB-5385]OZI09592.1 hypothetical protein BWI93_03145 [Siphonobacter sp. BAB-5385]